MQRLGSLGKASSDESSCMGRGFRRGGSLRAVFVVVARKGMFETPYGVTTTAGCRGAMRSDSPPATSCHRDSVSRFPVISGAEPARPLRPILTLSIIHVILCCQLKNIITFSARSQKLARQRLYAEEYFSRIKLIRNFLQRQQWPLTLFIRPSLFPVYSGESTIRVTVHVSQAAATSERLRREAPNT